VATPDTAAGAVSRRASVLSLSSQSRDTLDLDLADEVTLQDFDFFDDVCPHLPHHALLPTQLG
jgi:hypothetical protein